MSAASGSDQHAITSAVDELAQECVVGQDNASAATLLEVLEQAGIAKRFRVHPEKVAVADTNRDNMGLAAVDVGDNVEDVVITKWHDSIFKGALTDISANQFEKVCKFNEKLSAGSGGRLATIKRNLVEYKALRGNHTSSGHRAILNGCKHPSPDLTIDGKLNFSKIVAACPTLGPVLTLGAQWLVIPSWFLAKYPGLEEAIIGTCNLVNNTTLKETDLQIIGKISNKIKDGANYDDIKALMLKQRYKNVAALPGMFQFCRKFEKSRDGTDLVDET